MCNHRGALWLSGPSEQESFGFILLFYLAGPSSSGVSRILSRATHLIDLAEVVLTST